MRINDVNKDNYMDYLKLFGGKSTAALDAMWGKNKAETTGNAEPFDPQKHKNQFGLTGMWIGAQTKFDVVSVPEGARKELVDHVRKEIIDTYGGSKYHDEKEAIYKKYLTATPEKDRLNVAYSMDKIWLDEGNRVLNQIKEAIPGWQPGQAFDKNFVSELLSKGGLDMKV